MPDMQEVFRMATQKVGPDQGALERQHRLQRRTTTRRKLGALAVAAAIGLAAVVMILVIRPGENAATPANEPSTANPADADEVRVATGFLEAFGAFDAERARTYLADDADITGMTEGRGVEGLSLMTSFLEAQGYHQMITSCEASTFASETFVHCPFDFHAIRSDEIGLGPFSGSYFDVTVSDGEISHASMNWEIEKFSPQMWEPFRDWVSSTHPKDFAVMYIEGGSNFRLTEESIRLWEQRTREYVVHVKRSMETRAPGAPEGDYVIDLNTSVRTPLPESITRSLGGTAQGRGAESQYAASPDGSQLAYVGTGEEGSPQIYVAGIDGSGIRQVTHDPFGAGWPAWSPDGTRIAYQGGGGDLRDLLVLDVARVESTQIADGVALRWEGLQFTPDGSSLLYTGGSPSEFSMRAVPVAGGQSTTLFGAGHGGMGAAGSGSLSPDGSLVTMVGHEVGGPGANHFVANADGTGLRDIPGYHSNPAGTWSPDGSRIVCLKHDTRRSPIIVVDIVTGDASLVAAGSQAIWLDDHRLLVEA